jgi:nitrite reductase/ring-hydroxylating ferredoxin subunit
MLARAERQPHSLRSAADGIERNDNVTSHPDPPADRPQPRRWHTICAIEELEDPGAKGFLIQGEWPLHGFVVRRGERVYAYVNVCPHEGRSLQWKPDAFLTRDRRLIMCSAHGAIFEIETGLCVAGPCIGAHLRALPARIAGGLVDVAAA